MSLFEGPSVYTRLSRYSINHGLSICDVRLALGCSGRYVRIAHELLHRRAVEDPEIFVRFGLERWRVVDTFN